eukprot:s728_g25.t1
MRQVTCSILKSPSASSRTFKQPVASGFSLPGSKGADSTGGGCSLSFGGAGYAVPPHGGDTATSLGGLNLPMVAAGTSPSQAATPCGAYWPGPGCPVLPVVPLPALANMEQYRAALSPTVDQAAQDELQRVQAELRALKEEMVQLKQGYHEVKEQQETLGTTVTSIKERQDDDDDVLEWWKDPGPGTGLAPTSAQSPTSALEAGGGEMQQQIAQILTMLQQQQEQQRLERQMLHTSSPPFLTIALIRPLNVVN